MKANKEGGAVLCAVLAAALYALSTPLSKRLMAGHVGPGMMAALLYLGAGLGTGIMLLMRKASDHGGAGARPPKGGMKYVIGMILLDIAAPISLMAGLKSTTAANASLMNNFEIVATSLIAFMLFRERITRRVWWAIGLITVSTAILSFEGGSSLSFSGGSLLVLLACVLWGFENNCTRMLSEGDPLSVVVIKGLCSGTGALILALLAGERLPGGAHLAGALALGFVAYGLSIYFYVTAQRDLGAAKTSAYYAVAPFIGAALSMLIFRTLPGLTFIAALVIMALGVDLLSEHPVIFRSRRTPLQGLTARPENDTIEQTDGRGAI